MDEQPLRCISWVAVSTKAQAEKESPDEQRAKNGDVIGRLGGVLVAELNVPGQSRDIVEFSEAERSIEAYAELRQILDGRRADLLIFRDMSRLGRTAALTLQVAEMCHRAGVALYDRSSPPTSTDAILQASDDGRLLQAAIQGSMAQLEVRNLVRRYRYGMTGRLKAGKFPGSLPYGYRKVYERDGSEGIEVVEDEAEIVRLIFSMFMDGLAYGAIAEQLGAMSISGPLAEWSARTVWVVVRRVYVYAGFVEIRFKNQPVVRERGSHEPIIDLDDAKRIDRERTDRKTGSARRGQKLLTRVLICRECGGYLASNGTWRGNHHYRCHRCYKNEEVDTPIVRESAILDAIGQLIESWASPTILRQIVDKTQPESSDLLQAKLDRLEFALLKTEQERNRVIYMGRKGIIELDDVAGQLEPLDLRRAELRAEIEDIRANTIEIESSDERFERLRSVVRQFKLIEDTMNVDEANKMLRRNFRVYVSRGEPLHVEIL